MLEALTFVTGNAGKVKQLGQSLHFPIKHTNIDLVEIQSLDLSEIITFKAREAYRHLSSPVLVEDTSLEFLALGSLPGPFIKWFLAELGTEGLCRLLDGKPDRSARAIVQLGLYDGDTMHIFSGVREGTIALSPRGGNGFGWDPIFVPAGHQHTWAEMSEAEGQATSMRTLAVQQLQAFLKAQ